MKEGCDTSDLTCSPDTSPEQVFYALGAANVSFGWFDPSARLRAFNGRFADLMADLGTKALIGSGWEAMARDIVAHQKVPVAEDGWVYAPQTSRGHFSFTHRLPDGRAYQVAVRPTGDGGFLAIWMEAFIGSGGHSGRDSGSHAAGKKDKGTATLTPRQQEVIAQLSSGMSMKEVARSLGITPRTVAFHKYHVMEVNDLRSNSDFVAFAIRQNLLHV